MKKYVFVILTTIFFCFNLLAQENQQSLSGTCGENCNWVIENDTLKITGGQDGTIGHMNACAAWIDGVYTYNQPWQGLQSEFTKVDISGVDNIGAAAFRQFFSNVTEVTIGDSVTTVEQYAFANTKIKSVVMPDSLTHIQIHAFNSSVLEEVIIPDSIISAGNSYLGMNTEILEKLNIICKGDQEKCHNKLSQYTYYNTSTGKIVPFSLSKNVTAATSKNCESTNFYWDGSSCIREQDKTKRKCCTGCGQRDGICRRLIYSVDEVGKVAREINTLKMKYK